MNINFVVFARSPKGERELDRRFSSSVALAAHGSDVEMDSIAQFREGRSRLFCTQPSTPVWSVESVVQEQDTVVSFSMPPAPMREELPYGGWPAYVKQNLVHSFRPQEFAPNYFGARISPEGVDAWTDHMGMGRCYIVETEDYVAVSNHIGSLTKFLNLPPEVDEDALAKFVAFGWYPEESSPIRGVRRVPGASHIRVNSNGVKTESKYLSLEDIYVSDGEPADIGHAASEMMNLNANLSRMSEVPPTVFLSGGRDSRMTCGTWIGGGGRASVITYGDLPREAEVASELIDIYRAGFPSSSEHVTHDIRERSASRVTMSLDERIRSAFLMWDGDAGPVKLRGNVRPLKGRRYSVSGIGGEIAHGYFYNRPGAVERIEKMDSSMQRIEDAFGRPKYFTPDVRRSLDGFFEQKDVKYRSMGLSKFAMLDYFFLEEKMRRMSPQSLSTSSPVPLCTIGYQQMAFRLTIEQQVAHAAPIGIAETSVPGWGSVPAYKPTREETSSVAKTSVRTWQTDAEQFFSYFDRPHEWVDYIREDTINEARRRIDSGEMTEMFESWLLRAIWVDETYAHIRRLRRDWWELEEGF
ncbi:hypothetical protein [Brachybacterium avium]|uniref:hypothetical protein n=1 Tax=Brachybacterium avium TaxID=2017485 RepID=UPI0012FE0A19|nr:hypothetical protein [Brachybacterium avium]